MLAAVFLALAIAPTQSACSIDEVNAGLCSATNTGSSIEVGATRPGAATRPGGAGGGTGDTDAGDRTGEDTGSDTEPSCTNDLGRPCYSVVVLRPTLTDVASFAPTSLPLIDEPDGIGVVRMPVNFVVAPSAHEQTGSLFDLPVTVRFTPASVEFRHGDGTSRESAGGGHTWALLGLPQFSATTTSHAYAARGTYTASAVVRYAAAVDFGSGWVAVPGLLEVPTASMQIEIVDVRTALVEKTCNENPSGPGC